MTPARQHSSAPQATDPGHDADPGPTRGLRGSGTVRGRNTRAWTTVAAHEVSVRVGSRAFLITLVVSLVCIVGGIGLLSWLNHRTDTTTVAVAGQDARSMAEAAEHAQGLDLEVRSVASPDDVRRQVADGDADLGLWHEADHWVLASDDGSPGATGQRLSDTISAAVRVQNAERAGLSQERLDQGTEVRVVESSAGGHGAAAGVLGAVFVMLFYFATLIYGVPIAQSILEEKSNRIVEIIASTIPIGQLLAGKLVANIALAFAQLALFAAAGLAAMNVFDVGLELGWVLGSAGWYLLFFVLGFAAIAALYSVAGAMAARTEDLGTVQTPIMVVLMAVYFGGLFAQGTVQTVMSYLPVFSAVAMPMRLLRGEAQPWEGLVSAGIGVAALVLLMMWASRVYRRAVMRTGGTLSWSAVLRNRY